MTRMRKLLALMLLAAIIAVSAITAAFAMDNTKTYAYLPDHSVYFYDVAEGYSWAHREIDTLAVAEIVQGRGNHLFYPGDVITRADFILMLDRAYGMSEAIESGVVTGQGSFSDVPAGAYYGEAVAAAKAFGIATGTENNQFLPQQSITRQDAMVFLKRTLDHTQFALQPGALDGFSDASQVAAYAREAVGALIRAGVITGSEGQLNPQENITRAEIAVMLYRAIYMTTDQGGSAVYVNRDDVVNLCIGAQQYCNVVIENYNPAMHYGELMRYSGLRQQNGVTYITLESNQAIDRTVTYQNGVFTFNDPEGGAGATVSYPASANCVAIDVTTQYHQIGQPVSTGSAYQRCYPSIENGEVTAIYYISL